jgi:hypothetical protein
MDERLEKALEFANYRITLSNRKRDIKARMIFLQTLHHKSGTFIANEILIGFVDTLLRNGKKSAVIVDTNDNPIEIDDLEEFNDLLISAYIEASNEYKVQMDKVVKSRNIKKIMDW